jgi:hypothetical protein
VIAAVNLAREHDLPLAVRCGGHNLAGNGVCDDGLVIDLSRMKGVRVDPTARTARANFSTEKYAKLAALRAMWAPQNLFRLNQNVKPRP